MFNENKRILVKSFMEEIYDELTSFNFDLFDFESASEDVMEFMSEVESMSEKEKKTVRIFLEECINKRLYAEDAF